uniref:Putative secreted protein n=1 Tax=Ixodes ricinus TaxID=34613 RepID=A0A6B0U060_IXORI
MTLSLLLLELWWASALPFFLASSAGMAAVAGLSARLSFSSDSPAGFVTSSATCDDGDVVDGLITSTMYL